MTWTPRIRRGIPVGALLLALMGCAPDERDASSSLEEVAAPAAVPSPPRRPIATLPAELGRMSAIHVHDYADGFRQEILLDGSAARNVRNSLTVLARTSFRETLDEAVPLAKPSEASIHAEIAAAFPRLAMRIVERSSENAYGPYGLAIGRSGDDRCVFFWQWIDANRMPPDGETQGPLSIRAAICRSGSTFDAMAAAFDRLKITVASDAAVDFTTARENTDVRAARPMRRRHVVAAAHRSPADRSRHVADTMVMHYRAVGGWPSQVQPSALVSDLPPEALAGPRIASKQN